MDPPDARTSQSTESSKKVEMLDEAKTCWKKRASSTPVQKYKSKRSRVESSPHEKGFSHNKLSKNLRLSGQENHPTSHIAFKDEGELYCRKSTELHETLMFFENLVIQSPVHVEIGYSSDSNRSTPDSKIVPSLPKAPKKPHKPTQQASSTQSAPCRPESTLTDSANDFNHLMNALVSKISSKTSKRRRDSIIEEIGNAGDELAKAIVSAMKNLGISGKWEQIESFTSDDEEGDSRNNKIDIESALNSSFVIKDEPALTDHREDRELMTEEDIEKFIEAIVNYQMASYEMSSANTKQLHNTKIILDFVVFLEENSQIGDPTAKMILSTITQQLHLKRKQQGSVLMGCSSNHDDDGISGPAKFSFSFSPDPNQWEPFAAWADGWVPETRSSRHVSSECFLEAALFVSKRQDLGLDDTTDSALGGILGFVASAFRGNNIRKAEEGKQKGLKQPSKNSNSRSKSKGQSELKAQSKPTGSNISRGNRNQTHSQLIPTSKKKLPLNTVLLTDLTSSIREDLVKRLKEAIASNGLHEEDVIDLAAGHITNSNLYLVFSGVLRDFARSRIGTDEKYRFWQN